MIPIIRVNLRRAVGDRRLLFVATLFPILFILVTGLLAGSPKEPIGLVHPSPRLLHLVASTADLKVRVEPNRAQLGDDILHGARGGRAHCAARPRPGHSVSTS